MNTNRIKKALRIWGYVHYILGCSLIIINHELLFGIVMNAMGLGWVIVGGTYCPLIEWIFREPNQ